MQVVEEERRQARVAAAKVLREHAGGPRSHRALAKASSGDLGPGPSAGADDKVYLKDLTLEDRERVLRLLFAKINIAHKATKPIATDFDDDDFGERANSEASDGGFYLTQMDGGENDGQHHRNSHHLPEITPGSRGSNV